MAHMTELITKWSHQTVTIGSASTSYDSYGNPMTSVATAVTALVQYNTRAAIDSQGKQRLSNCQILLTHNSTISIDDKITLPDGSQPTIINIEKQVDFEGNVEYIKVYT